MVCCGWDQAHSDKLSLISFLLSSKYFSFFQCVNKTERKNIQSCCFSSPVWTGLIPSINFISPLNRHYVKMRGLTRIFKSESGHLLWVMELWHSRADNCQRRAERPSSLGEEVSGGHQSVGVWKLWHNNLITVSGSWNTNDWHQPSSDLVSNTIKAVNLQHSSSKPFENALIIFTFRNTAGNYQFFTLTRELCLICWNPNIEN